MAKRGPSVAKKAKADEGPRSKKAKVLVDDAAEKTATAGARYWLLKSEPDLRMENGHKVSLSLADLQALPKQTSGWDGVRNYQARNFLRDQLKIGDLAFFYHSSCREPGIAGVVEVVREGYPDESQFDKKHPYYDPTAAKENPRWYMVDVRFRRELDRYLPLSELRTHSDGELKDMALLCKSRLSVQPVSKEHWEFIHRLEKEGPPQTTS